MRRSVPGRPGWPGTAPSSSSSPSSGSVWASATSGGSPTSVSRTGEVRLIIDKTEKHVRKNEKIGLISPIVNNKHRYFREYESGRKTYVFTFLNIGPKMHADYGIWFPPYCEKYFTFHLKTKSGELLKIWQGIYVWADACCNRTKPPLTQVSQMCRCADVQMQEFSYKICRPLLLFNCLI